MYVAAKRAFDFVCSIIGLCIACPFMIIIAIGIKLSSKGPVFYATERIGVNNKPFTMYKFRSMHVYRSAEGEDNKKSEGGYIANTQRIFKFGAFLRKSKLDEIPQLINIFLSQMSFVGPRPVSKSSVDKNYTGEYKCILNVKPGLACLDSLFDYAHGELFVKDNDEYKRSVIPVRTELAKMYVDQRNVNLDTYIIYRTIKLILIMVFTSKKDFPLTKYEKIAINRINQTQEKTVV